MKILVLDIETRPNLVWAWGLFKQNISINQIVEPSTIMCWAAKWVGKKPVYFADERDPDMMALLWDLLDEADVVVSYNGKRFDMPTINKEFVKRGWAPPSRYRQVDLLQTVRREFRFTSTKMDHVCRELGLGSKTQHSGMSLWKACMDGDKRAWGTMKKYNKQDVKLTEQLYNELLPWITNHPNWGMYVDSDNPVCPNCASDKIIKKGMQVTQTRTYQRYRCNGCGAPLQERTSGGKQLK